jgi:hypothetical protein
MTDQLREAARALLDYLDAGGVTYGRPLVAEGRIADLRAALDAAPPAVDVACAGCGNALHYRADHGDDGCTRCTCSRWEPWDATPPAVDVERLVVALRVVDERIAAAEPEHAVELLDAEAEIGRRDFAVHLTAEYARLGDTPMTDLDAIRERARLMGFNGASIVTAQEDRRALLAYIDGLAEAVGKADGRYEGDTLYVSRAAVLAILRGE